MVCAASFRNIARNMEAANSVLLPKPKLFFSGEEKRGRWWLWMSGYPVVNDPLYLKMRGESSVTQLQTQSDTQQKFSSHAQQSCCYSLDCSLVLDQRTLDLHNESVGGSEPFPGNVTEKSNYMLQTQIWHMFQIYWACFSPLNDSEK